MSTRLTREIERMNAEPATVFLRGDCWGGSTDANVRSRRTKKYRDEHGIIFPDQFELIARVEWLSDNFEQVVNGIFWRTHPGGRTVREGRGRGIKGYGYYV